MIAHDHDAVPREATLGEAADAVWYAVRMLSAGKRGSEGDDVAALDAAHDICTSALGVLSQRLLPALRSGA